MISYGVLSLKSIVLELSLSGQVRLDWLRSSGIGRNRQFGLQIACILAGKVYIA